MYRSCNPLLEPKNPLGQYPPTITGGGCVTGSVESLLFLQIKPRGFPQLSSFQAP